MSGLSGTRVRRAGLPAAQGIVAAGGGVVAGGGVADLSVRPFAVVDHAERTLTGASVLWLERRA